MKEGSLFYFVIMRCTDWIRMLQIMLFLIVFGKLPMRRMHGLGSMTIGLVVQKFFKHQMISSLKIRLNRSWKFRRNWNVPLVLLERSWWAGFNAIYLVRLGFKMWEVLKFNWFFALENSNKFQKARFWKEKSVEDVVTLGPPAQATLYIYI